MASDDVLKTMERGLEMTLSDIRRYMASPEGREMRERLAKGLMISAPLLLRMPFVRATPAGRLIGAFGGTALIVKLARSLRDWEPTVDIRPVD